MDKLLSLLGLAKKAGRLVSGEEPVGAAAGAHDARLILFASDAAENSLRRGRHFAEAGDCLWAQLPADKEALGRAVGRPTCAMLALTDIGFAEAAGKRLAAVDAERYGALAERLGVKAARSAERKEERKQHDKNSRAGKKRNKK